MSDRAECWERVPEKEQADMRRLVGQLREACRGVRAQAERLAGRARFAAAARVLEAAALRGEAVVRELEELGCEVPSS